MKFKKREDHLIEEAEVSIKDRNICPVCGGTGVEINESHELSYTDYEQRYVICRNCYGIGTVPSTEK